MLVAVASIKLRIALYHVFIKYCTQLIKKVTHDHFTRIRSVSWMHHSFPRTPLSYFTEAVTIKWCLDWKTYSTFETQKHASLASSRSCHCKILFALCSEYIKHSALPLAAAKMARQTSLIVEVKVCCDRFICPSTCHWARWRWMAHCSLSAPMSVRICRTLVCLICVWKMHWSPRIALHTIMHRGHRM